MLDDYPTLKHYLGTGMPPNAGIVHSPIFENAVATSLQNQSLSNAQQAILDAHLLKKVSVGGQEAQPVTFVQKVYAEKLRKLTGGLYGDLSWIPSTSNRAERLFSRSKYYLNDYRKRLLPVHLESELFLCTNRDFWDVFDVEQLIN